MINITEMLAPKGTNCRPAYAMTPIYITVHNTANTSKGAGAVSHGKYLKSAAGSAKYVSYHYAVDDKNVVRIIPDNEAAWHAGDGANGAGNRKSIGIEICENPESDLRTATDNAAMLCAVLCKTYSISLANVVQHNKWSGKNCPNRIRAGEPYDWATFVAKVCGYYKALADGIADETDGGKLYLVQTGAFASRENAEKYAENLKANGVAAFVKEQ
jgi:N-acetylmuramoyl-L-alanine amidase